MTTATTATTTYYATTEREGWTRANALRVRAKAWTSYPVGLVLAHVRTDGTVCAFDDVACRWTTCHRLSARAQARIRALANA